MNTSMKKSKVGFDKLMHMHIALSKFDNALNT